MAWVVASILAVQVSAPCAGRLSAVCLGAGHLSSVHSGGEQRQQEGTPGGAP